MTSSGPVPGPAPAPARRAGETSAIHDIGYRRYDGPRLGGAAIERALLWHTLRGAYGLGRPVRSKVMPMVLLGLLTVPAVIVSAVAIATKAGELPLRYSAYTVNLQVVVAVFVASQAPQVVSRDLRFRVVALYFSRPLSRAGYVRAKVLAMTAALFVLLGVPLLVLYAGALLAKMSVWANTRDALLGLAGVAVFAVVLACLGLVVAAFTPRRGLGVAAVIAVLLVLAGVSGAVQGIATEQGNADVAGWAGLVSPFSLVDGVQVWVLGARTSTAQGPPGALGGVVFVLVALLLVAGSVALLLQRYRRVSVS